MFTMFDGIATVRKWLLILLISAIGVTGMTGCLVREDHDHDHGHWDHHDDDHFDRR